LRKWQIGRLRNYLRDTVLPFSAHYSALFRRESIAPAQIETADDLRRIPFTTKANPTRSAPSSCSPTSACFPAASRRS
jgi:phenylacetate-coenzyme A ligase PaaK-like adenylate-forming protein